MKLTLKHSKSQLQHVVKPNLNYQSLSTIKETSNNVPSICDSDKPLNLSESISPAVKKK